MQPDTGFATLHLLIGLGEKGTVLALLLCGHTLGDFVFQTDQMVRRKSENRWLAAHALQVTVLQGLLLLPFTSLPMHLVLLVLAGIGFSHLLIDHLKVHHGKRLSPFSGFALDQALHLLVVLGAWLVLTSQAAHSLLSATFSPHSSTLASVAIVLAAYGFNLNGSGAIIGALLENYKLSPGEGQEGAAIRLRMGRMIGILERMLVLTLVLIDQWSALGLILAAKSLARFKDLEQRNFSEYYLIGTLSSVLLAIVSGLIVKILI